MSCCARALPALLIHVNLLLMLYAGAALATSARLVCDPTLYVALRELLPLEYRVLAVMLPVSALALLMLAQLAVTALRCRRPSLRRALLILYAVAMCIMVALEVGCATWVALRVHDFINGPEVAAIKHALATREHLEPLLEHLAFYHPLPHRLKEIIEEAEVDFPRYGWVCGGVTLGFLVLQTAAVVTAAATAAAVAPRRRRTRSVADTYTTTTPLSIRKGDVEKMPLRAVYRNGKLVLV